MNGRFRNPFVSEQEEPEIGSENGGELTFSGVITDRKMKTNSSPKKSRRDAQKRVVSVAINNMDGSPRIKSEGPPPSDSWAWRKYGQKPIKGSPYPRGYYRCSSLKGCPARKQVERSRLDPTKLVITYACEHNHPSPPSRNPNSTSTSTSATIPEFQQDELGIFTNQLDIESDDKFVDLGDESLIIADDYYSWFSEVVSTSPTILENPICAGTSSGDADVAMIFRMDEEEESMYADLGELPECSMVFRRGFVEAEEEERRRCSLSESSLCGSTG